MRRDDPLINILHVNLTTKDFRVERREDLFEQYLGGAGVAATLLHEHCPEGCDPLSPDNPIVLAVGPLTGLFPLASKTVAMFKSPHTGNLGESHCGGRSAVAIRMAGYGAIVITGASDIPVYVAIHGDRVYFRNATTLWGMSSCFTAGRIIREKEPSAGLRTIMRIGKAGEKQVSYACVTTETYRHFGRLGLGAVFGSKKLKAVVVSGKRSLPVEDHRQYRKLYKQMFQEAVDSPVMQKYHDLGTAENVLPLNAMGGLPTRNLKQTHFEAASEISGEAFAQHYLGRRLACAHCPVACIHIAALREVYADEAYFYKTSMIGYDYEPIFALGSMLGISDPPSILKLMDRVEALGIDVMSCGVVLAWATEALQRGIINESETNGIALRWNDCSAYLKAANCVVEQSNEFYRALARGVDFASRRYGGQDYAMAFGGNEMPGYHTGPAAHAGFLVGARHSHLDNAGYSIDQKTLVDRSLAPDELAQALVSEEQRRQVLSSLVVCFFAQGLYRPETVARALSVVGLNVGKDSLERIGRDVLRQKYSFKCREGFSIDDLRIPRRVFEIRSLVRDWDEEYVRKTVEAVGRTLSNGITSPNP